jgi:hypothetical protein
MVIDYSNVIAIAATILYLVSEIRARRMQAKTVEIISHAADAVAYVRDRATTGQLCDMETLKKMSVAAEDIWVDLGFIGSNVKAMLDKKSSLAETLKPISKEQ